MAKTRTRYILNGGAKATDKICDYGLIGAVNIKSFCSALRVNIPDDLELEKWSCDDYSTTSDTRTIGELGYDVMVKINKRWRAMNELKGVEPHEIHTKMAEKGYHPLQYYGYVSHEMYKKWMNHEIIHYDSDGNPLPNYQTLYEIMHSLNVTDERDMRFNIMSMTEDYPKTVYVIDSKTNDTYEIIPSPHDTLIRKNEKGNCCFINVPNFINIIKDQDAIVNAIAKTIILL